MIMTGLLHACALDILRVAVMSPLRAYPH